MIRCSRRRFLGTAAAGLVAASAPLPAQSVGSLGYKNMRGLPAPPLVLNNLDGRSVNLQDYRGTVVMVNFWADWCAPCLQEFPSMLRAWQAMRGAGVELLTVHVGGDATSVRRFMQDKGLSFPVVVDEGAKVFKQWPSSGLPTTFIIDQRGRLVYGAAGAREWDTREMMTPILALVKQKA